MKLDGRVLAPVSRRNAALADPGHPENSRTLLEFRAPQENRTRMWLPDPSTAASFTVVPANLVVSGP